MSLGLPSTNNQTTVTGVASLFSTLGKGQAGAERSGLDWASTLRQTATQQREYLERSRPTVSDKTATRSAESAKDRAADRAADRSTERPSDRADDAADRQARDHDRDEAIDSRIKNRADQRDDASADDPADVSAKDDASSFTDQDVAADEAVTDDTQGVAQAQDQTTDEDDADHGPVDELTLEAAGAQAIAQVVVDAVSQAGAQASAQVSQNAQAVQSQNETTGKTEQQAKASASQLQPTAQAASNQAATLATQVTAGQTKGQGQGEGKAALPAQAANATAAQAQQNPALNTVAADGESASQQQGQHDPQHSSGQSGQSGQPGQTAHVQSAQPGAGSAQQAALALDIQTTAGGTNATGNTAAGVTTAPAGQGATPNVMTLPAGADPLMQSQDDADPNVTRIAQGLRSAVNLKGGAVTIRLNPHELGSVRIEMEIKNGNVSAQLQTEHASVRDLLNHQLGKLRETLQGRGLHVERLEVNAPAPADDSSAGRNAQESPDQGRSRGQFFQQRGGSGGSGSQSGSGSQHQGQNVSDFKAFGDMLVDMVG